jgi:ankyrin repeat protein
MPCGVFHRAWAGSILGFMYRASTSEEQDLADIMSQVRHAVCRNLDLLLRDIAQAMRLAAVTVDTRDASGDTPLHYAVYWGDVRAIRMLAGAGAEIDAPGENGATPLFSAVLHGRYSAARSLFELGASPHVRSAFGTPADAAAQSHDSRMRVLFERSGAR